MSEFSDSLANLVKQQTISFIVSKVPFLGSSVFQLFLGPIVGYLAKVIINETEVALYIIAVNAKTKKQAENVKKAQDNLDNAKTPEQYKKAEDELKESLKDLINISN